MALIRSAAALSLERQNPCTHITMTRLFNVYGSFKCVLCQRHPSIGWLYRCTQDAGGFLPESDFTLEQSVLRSQLDEEVTTHSLSDSVIKAIGEGHYTDEQVKKIIQLKEGVRELVMSQLRSDDGRPDTSSTFSTASSCYSSSSSDGDCTFSTIPQSTTFSTNSSTSLDEEIKQAYDWKELQKVWMSEPSMTPPKPRIYSFPPSLPPAEPLPPRPAAAKAAPTLPTRQPCTLKICPTCRPTYRDRAYQSLEEILHKPVQMPPLWELQNRRLSDARIVARIGLPKLGRARFYSQTDPAALLSSCTIPAIMVDDTGNEVAFYDESAIDYVTDVPGADGRPDKNRSDDTNICKSPSNKPGLNENYSNTLSDTQSVRKRSSFRQSVCKVLTKAHRGNAITGDSSTDSHPRAQPKSRASNSLIFRRRRSRASTLSFVEAPGARVVDTSPLQDSVMLMVATNTPLPQTPKMNGFNLGPGGDASFDRENIRVEEDYLPPMQMVSQA